MDICKFCFTHNRFKTNEQTNNEYYKKLTAPKTVVNCSYCGTTCEYTQYKTTWKEAIK